MSKVSGGDQWSIFLERSLRVWVHRQGPWLPECHIPHRTITRWQFKLCGACLLLSFPWTAPCSSDMKGKRKSRNSYQDTKGKSQSTLKSLGVLPSKLIEPEFHALSHSINIKEIMSTDLPRRTSLSNSHITGISWTARQMFQEHMSIASQRRSQATACTEALR